MKLEVAGTTLTNYMREVIEAQAPNMSYSQAGHAAQDIIKRMCYVKTDNDCGTVLNKTYVLPDGRNIKVGEERVKCPQVLFQPLLAGRKNIGKDVGISRKKIKRELATLSRVIYFVCRSLGR